MKPKLRLSIIIPVYNEAKKLGNTFSRLDRFFSHRGYEMEYIIVDDGSSDATLRVAQEIVSGRRDTRVLKNGANSGKGFSIKKGMLAATGDFSMFMDADMSTPLNAFDEFARHFEHYDIIMGSRWRKESNIRIPQPWYRRFMGMIFYIIVRSFFLDSITDTNCGFKCYRGSVAKDIFSAQKMKRWGFDVELLYIAQKRGYRIKEVPVVWAHSKDSKVNLLQVPLQTLWELTRIKINDFKGAYEK